MKILLIMDPGIPVPPSKYGGIERIVFLLANEYQKLGHEVTLIAGPDSKCDGTTIHFGVNKMQRPGWQKCRETLFIWNYLMKNRYTFDLIHNFGRLIYLLPVINQKACKIMSYQRAVTPRNIKFITKLPNKNLNFTACSDYCKSTGNNHGKWQTIYNAVDFCSYDLRANSQLHAPLIFLGRLDKIKGVHTAIQVAKDSGNRLWIAGNVPVTKDNYAYYNACITNQIDDHQIIYLGELNDEQKNHYLGKSKALLFPIEWEEPFGIVMIEAMACGTPVIAFNRGAVPEVVNDYETGFKVNNTTDMLSKTGLLSEINRTQCRQKAQERFDVSIIARQYLKLISDN